MPDEVCPRCGWVLGTSATACPACGEPIAERRSGFETVYYPAAGAEAESASMRVDGVPSGTALVPDDGSEAELAGLRLKVKTFLTCRGGSQNGRRLDLGCPATTIGRASGEISLDDPTLSSRHFQIEERGHEFFLRDLGSTNGTFLNGHLVRSAPLKTGDEIRAGESVFVFSVLEVIPCD